MGPQLDSCGKIVPIFTKPPVPGLQWGRNLTVAESICRDASGRAAGRLQWGRNLTVAERAWTAYMVLFAFGQLQWGRNLTVAER